MRRQSITRAASLVVATFTLFAGLMAVNTSSASAQTFTGIRNTKHNLSSMTITNDTRNNASNTVGEVCVFCHTPHGSSTTAAAPLWNRKIDASKQYDLYKGNGAFDGASTIGFIASSVSLACLSCHDGTQAMDTVLNAPGSGKYDAGGFAINGGWKSPSGSGAQSGGMLTGVANLGGANGKDLTNDHPVGMEYAKWAGATRTLDADFKEAVRLGTKDIWYVESGKGDANTRDKKDMWLYTRDSTNSTLTAATPYVECASCHDPHEETSTFLRIPNTNSDVCLTCHTK
ncbi:MAG TPA: cytochrome c3 family protein [Azospirillum sp.]|nr:cytochrome c3 family protein [Azospirillum sp.]